MDTVMGGHHSYRHHSHGGDEGAALLTGLILGGLLGYFINQDRRRYYEPYRPRYRHRDYAYTHTPRRVTAGAGGSSSDCLMTREYTTTVMIDGRERQAYGTRCMRADGSWRPGAAKLVPEFN